MKSEYWAWSYVTILFLDQSIFKTFCRKDYIVYSTLALISTVCIALHVCLNKCHPFPCYLKSN